MRGTVAKRLRKVAAYLNQKKSINGPGYTRIYRALKKSYKSQGR